MPDELFFEDCYIPLHSFLRIHMKMQNKYIQNFRSKGKNYVFGFSFTGHSGTDGEMLWETYEACIDAAKTAMQEQGGVGVDINKLLVQSGKIQWGKTKTIQLNKDLAIVNIVPGKEEYDPDDERFYLNGEPIFQEMQISIPSPFRKGECVVNVYDNDQEPFVLDEPTIPASDHTKSGGGVEYMYRLVDGWFEDESGFAYMRVGCDFLDLEYDRTKSEKSRFLRAMSRYLMGEISLFGLLDEYGFSLLQKNGISAGKDDEDDRGLPFLK